ncbi:MAG: glycoside hydrolase family 16 protein [Lachnospiraceae bacterium]|nr:glycoside hydrolase family 16 protein [Lachnospiraceae bacterium]
MRKWKKVFAGLICAVLFCACANKTGDNATNAAGTDDADVTPVVTVTVAPETTVTPKADITPTTKPTPTPVPTPTPLPKCDPLYVEFKDGSANSGSCEIADGWSNGNMFNVTWRKANCTFTGDKMQLIINTDSGSIPYSGAEYRSRKFFGYGRYEVSLKAIKNDGVVTSFFTYTGPTDKNPWDEIDIEILGKDTSKVQFNYFTNGRGNHEYMHDLGFDASEDFHTYAFEWHKDKIVWFIDGVEVYTATDNIPTHRGKIMMNAWCGKNVDSWLKPFDDSNLPLIAEYEWFSYTPFDEE